MLLDPPLLCVVFVLVDMARLSSPMMHLFVQSLLLFCVFAYFLWDSCLWLNFWDLEQTELFLQSWDLFFSAVLKLQSGILPSTLKALVFSNLCALSSSKYFVSYVIECQIQLASFPQLKLIQSQLETFATASIIVCLETLILMFRWNHVGSWHDTQASWCCKGQRGENYPLLLIQLCALGSWSVVCCRLHDEKVRQVRVWKVYYPCTQFATLFLWHST